MANPEGEALEHYKSDQAALRLVRWPNCWPVMDSSGYHSAVGSSGKTRAGPHGPARRTC
jgi:hypothetical protein